MWPAWEQYEILSLRMMTLEIDMPHVYRTDDGGATWRSIDGVAARGIPDIPCHWIAVRACDRDQLFVGATVQGPALIIEPHQTVVVEPGWRMDVTGEDNLVLTRVTPRQREILGEAADPVLLEVFNNLFMSIAEQMGEALRNTAPTRSNNESKLLHPPLAC